MRYLRPAIPFILLSFLILDVTTQAFATDCPGGSAIINFKLTVSPIDGGSPLAIETVNIIGPGDKIVYEPIKVPKDLQQSARVSLILIRVGDGKGDPFQVLAPQAVNARAEWPIQERISAVGVVFGPHGIDAKKVAGLVEKHPEIVNKVADYAEQSSRVEALVQTLSKYEQSPPSQKGLQSVLQGFSAQYGVKLPTLDDKSDSAQQAVKLLQAVAPAVSSNDPMPTRSSVISKTGGLAESLAAGYFGAPMIAAIGGATLLDSLYSSLFPATNFQSAYVQPVDPGAMMLCSGKPADAKTRARIDYLWVSRIPNQNAPEASLISDVHIPLGIASSLTVSTATVAELPALTRARTWRLVSGPTVANVPIKIVPGTANDTVTLDLTQAKLPPGNYELDADWDWTSFQLKGVVHVHAIPNLTKASVASSSRDGLISGRGPVRVQLTGPDFEFVESAALQSGNGKKLLDVTFTLPKGIRQGEQTQMQTEIDTSKLSAGLYALAIKQQNGVTANVPVTVHQPNPELTQTPMRVNVGEIQQTLTLHGKYLERIEKIVTPGAEWTLAAVPKGISNLGQRQATVQLDGSAHAGDQLNAEIVVADLENPLTFDDIVTVAGRRPKIVHSTRSFASQSGLELRDGEIPASGSANFSLTVENIESRPSIVLGCNKDERTRHKVSLNVGEKVDAAQFDTTSPGSLFVSVEPGLIGDSGCDLVAQVTTEAGTSDKFVLGRVVRLPHIDKFELSDEKLADSTYSGTLTGEDLQLVERTGWNGGAGEPVQSIPTPVPGNPQQQVLNISMPWPPPSPKAPLYVWLRGESQPRQTNVRY